MQSIDLTLVDIARELLLTTLMVAGPVLIVGLLVGVSVSLFQDSSRFSNSPFLQKGRPEAPYVVWVGCINRESAPRIVVLFVDRERYARRPESRVGRIQIHRRS